MSVWDILCAAGRRWYVVIAGLLLTLGALYGIHQAPGVYSTQTNVLLLAPLTPNSPNTISSPTSGVISMAGLVERIVNRGVEKSPTSGAVSLTGQGVVDGHSIELPNSGGQWASNFNRPVLQVQVAGPDPAAVRTQLAKLVEQIRSTTRELQQSDGVGLSMLITTQSSPAEPVVSFQQGHRKIGLAVTGLLGVVLTGLAVVAVDALVRRRRRIIAALLPHHQNWGKVRITFPKW